MTVGLYVGKPSIWAAWTKDWNANKRKVPRGRKPIKVYHSVDAHNRDGEFEGWTQPERNAYVANLLPVIGRHLILGVLIGIHMDAFRAAMVPYPELQEMFGTPYAACFQWAVQTMTEMLDERGSRQRVAFFHESNDYKKEAEAAFAYVEKETLITPRSISLTFGGKRRLRSSSSRRCMLLMKAITCFAIRQSPKDCHGRRLNPGAESDPEKRRIRVLQFGKTNMDWLINSLADFRISPFGGRLGREGR